MAMGILWALQTTPAPSDADKLFDQGIKTLDRYNNLGSTMAILLLLTLLVLAAIAVIIVVLRPKQQSSFNAVAASQKILLQTIEDERKEKAEIEAEKIEDKRKFIESLTVIGEQVTRSNDLFEAHEKRGQERDNTQVELSRAVTVLVQEGSKPLQKVMGDVSKLVTDISALDARTSRWQDVMDSIPSLRAEINAKLDLLMQELSKRATKPIPLITVETPAIEDGSTS